MGWRARPSARKNPESNPGLTYQTQEGGGLAAKDGTNHGGRRVRAGAKPDPLKDKLEAGKPASRLLEPADLDSFGLDGVSMDEGAVRRQVTTLIITPALLGLFLCSHHRAPSAPTRALHCTHHARCCTHPSLCIHRDHLWSRVNAGSDCGTGVFVPLMRGVF